MAAFMWTFANLGHLDRLDLLARLVALVLRATLVLRAALVQQVQRQRVRDTLATLDRMDQTTIHLDRLENQGREARRVRQVHRARLEHRESQAILDPIIMHPAHLGSRELPEPLELMERRETSMQS